MGLVDEFEDLRSWWRTLLVFSFGNVLEKVEGGDKKTVTIMKVNWVFLLDIFESWVLIEVWVKEIDRGLIDSYFFYYFLLIKERICLLYDFIFSSINFLSENVRDKFYLYISF